MELTTRPSGALDPKPASLDYILLDGSSSMTEKWWETLAAIDAYVDRLQSLHIRSHLTLTVFSDYDLEFTQRDQGIDEWQPLSQVPATAHWGATPLYDAINVMGRRLRDLDPVRCSIIIATDGDENRSKFTSLTQARAILDWMRAKGWQVTFIGCDFDNTTTARLLGANPSSAIGVRKQLLTDAAKSLAEKRARYGLYGENMHFTDDERTKFGGYLTDGRS
jgi:hypothetical protein